MPGSLSVNGWKGLFGIPGFDFDFSLVSIVVVHSRHDYLMKQCFSL